MKDTKPLLQSKDKIFEILDLPIRDGIELEKGVQLTEDYLEVARPQLEQIMDTFVAYPDIYLDVIASENSPSLFFYQRIFLRAVMRYKEVYVVACLKGDTPILTEHGMVPISQYNPNDKVWSNGKWELPENLNRREWHGNLVKLSADNCLEDQITVTDDHKFLVIQREKNFTRPGFFWKDGLNQFNISKEEYNKRKEFYRTNLRVAKPHFIQAKDLTVNDWLLSEIDLEEADIDFLMAPDSPPHTKNFIKEKIYLNEDFYEWLGIWLAEGSWEKDRISFTINIEEERLKNRIIQLSKNIFGIEPKVYERENHSQVLCLNSSHLRVFFESLFGCKSDNINQWNKWIPSKLLHCAPHKQLQLVKGWLDGDGYYRKTGNCHRYKGTTVSSCLCEGIKICLYRNFINPSITVENREGKAKVYNININGSFAFEIENSINENRSLNITNEMRLGEYYPIKYNNKYYMRNKVHSIEILPPDDEDVWCLQLKDGVFNVDGVESHNCRAFSKSFISILGMFLQCMFIPGTRRFICAPNKVQGAQIAKEKIFEIYDKWPLLRKEVIGSEFDPAPGNFGKDYVLIKFKNGSTFEVTGALESTRGQRKHGGFLDELRDADATTISEIVLPLLNVSRRLPDNTVNEREPNQQVIVGTSAGTKISYAYDKLIDMFENSIISPSNAFVFGCDYRVPVMHGLISRKFVNELKMSPSYNEESFAREYLSIWSGASDESWFNFNKMDKHRKIKNPEFHAKNRPGSEQFYFISVDVANLGDCQSVVCIFRVNIVKGKYHSTLVNLVVLGKTIEEKTFTRQAADIKRLIALYNPREVLIDCNGLGRGLAEEMFKEQYAEDGTLLPAYGFFNDDDYKKIQPKDARQILYCMIASSKLNSDINSETYARINGGLVHFLIKEQEAKSALLSTQVGQKMSPEQRIKRLMPHELTSSLFDEMANLRLKRTSSGTDIILEQINSRLPKDKYSAFSYGLWRIGQIEKDSMKKARRRGMEKRVLTFFTDGGR